MSVDVAALRRVVTLLHIDDAFWRPRLVDAPGMLNDEERALVNRVDRRAFAADPELVPRAATALLGEFPVTVAVVGVPRLFEFFRSPSMLAVVDGGALHELLPDFVDGHPAARIEACVAAARRRRRHRGPLTLAPGVAAAAALPRGSVDAWASLRALLGADPPRAVLAGQRLRWPGAVTVGEGGEGVVVERGLVDPAVGACSAPLGLILTGCASPAGRSAVVALCRAAGCDDDDEASELLSGLVADGLLSGDM